MSLIIQDSVHESQPFVNYKRCSIPLAIRVVTAKLAARIKFPQSTRRRVLPPPTFAATTVLLGAQASKNNKLVQTISDKMVEP